MLINEAKSRLEAETHIDKARLFLGLGFEFKKSV